MSASIFHCCVIVKFAGFAKMRETNSGGPVYLDWS